jgi:hypothetical protein
MVRLKAHLKGEEVSVLPVWMRRRRRDVTQTPDTLKRIAQL